MGSVLREYYSPEQVVQTKDYVYVQGSIPVALVAHADTVHVQLPHEIFYDEKTHVMWSPEGIGADDRAGIFAIIDIIRDGLRPTVIICNDEEIGGLGAKAFVHDYPKPPSQINFMIELDRMGENDMVFYSCDNEEFEEYIRPYGFISDWGSFSDISTIAPQWGVAAVNLSIGYIDEHTKSERLYFDWFFATVDKVKSILQDEMVESHPFIYIENPDPYADYNKIFMKYASYPGEEEYGYDYGYKYSASGTTPIKHYNGGNCICEFCGNNFSEEDEVSIFEAGQWFHICPTCAKSCASLCEECGKYFFPQNDKDTICSSCRRIKYNGQHE